MNTRTTIILLVVAIALGAGMLLMLDKEQKDAQAPVVTASKAKDLFEPKVEAVARVRIEQPDRPARAFEQRGEEWYLAEPVKAKAQKHAVQDDARALSELQYVQKYEAGSQELPGDDLTGLSKPNLVLTFQGKDGASHTVKVGNVRPMTEDETYVSKDNDSAVYVVKQNLLAKFTRPLNDYRERRVAEIPFSDITKVKVAGAQNYEAVKSGEEWVLEKPVRGRADRAKLDAMLQAAANLYTENFVTDDDRNLRPYGLAEPQLVLTVTTETKAPASQPAATRPALANQPTETQPAASQPVEVKTTTLLVGGKAGTQYFAKMADSPTVFQIADSVFKSLSVPLSDARDKSIAQVDPARVKALDLTVGGQSVMLARQDGRWQMAGALVGPVETGAVEDLLKAISQAKATAFEDEPKPELTPYGFEQPRARIRVISEGKVEPAEILVGGNSPSGEMVFVQNVSAGTIAVLKKPDAEGLVVEPSSLLERSIFSFARDDAEKIEITRNGKTTTLVKHGGDWQLAEPAVAADKDAVTSILADLSALRARKVVAVAQDEKYGLNAPETTVKVHVKDLVAASQPAATQPVPATQPLLQPTTKTYSLLISRQPAGAYAKMAEGTWVYEIDPLVSAHLGAELRDRAVVKFDATQAASIKVPTDNGQTLEFVKKDEKWTYLADPFVQVDGAKVTEWLGLLAGVRAERFVASKLNDDSEFGLDKPLYAAEVVTGNGKATRLVVAKPTESGKHVATVAGTSAAFEVPEPSVTQLRKPLGFFKGQ